MDPAIAVAILAVFAILFAIAFELAMRVWERGLTARRPAPDPSWKQASSTTPTAWPASVCTATFSKDAGPSAQAVLADLLLRAADEIEADGGYVVVAFERIGGPELAPRAYDFLRNWLDVSGIASWEDAHTRAEIVAKLRQAAQAARTARDPAR